MRSNTYKIIEFLIIFILTPISFVLEYSKILKLTIGILGFIYIIYVLLKVENHNLKIEQNLNWKQFWSRTLLIFILISVSTTIFVWLTDKESLLKVMINKPKLWLFILFVYSLFSVYPQELIYRTFFFKRYTNIIKNENFFIFINALIFSLAHIIFKNPFVLLLTFIGGFLFALTYKRTKSTLLASIEHAIYGCWLFTVGMGNMLGFPS